MREQTNIAGLDPATLQAWGAVANAMAGPAVLRTHLRIGAAIAIAFLALGIVFLATFITGLAIRLFDVAFFLTIADGVDLFLGALSVPFIGISALLLKRMTAGLRAISQT